MPSLPKFIRQDGPPLYPNILYNRPVTRHGAGRLLVIGGHSGEFSLPINLYRLAMAAGIGECQVALPDSLVRLVGGAPGATFVPASPSGSLGREALGQILHLSEEADAVAIGASLSNNSHTSILVEKLIQEMERPVVVFDEVLISMKHNLKLITDKPNCLAILTMPEVFKLCGALGLAINIRPGGGLVNKLEIVRDLVAASKCQYVVYGSEIIVAAGDEMVVTPVNYRLSLVPAAFYAILGTMWLQNPTRHREGLVTGAYVLREIGQTVGSEERPSVSQIAKTTTKVLEQEAF